MLRTLRRRSIVSHLLPLVLMVPLLGIILIEAVERQVLLPGLEQELAGQAQLIAVLAQEQPAVFSDHAQGVAFVTHLHPSNADLKLLDTSGHLLASTDPLDNARLGVQLQFGIQEAQQGQSTIVNNYSQRLGDELIGVVVPVMDSQSRLLGIVRLTYPLRYINQRVLTLRYIVLGVSLITILIGGLVGTVLAVALQRPLEELKQAVDQLGGGEQWRRLPESEPQEIGQLIRAFNTLVDRLEALQAARRQLLANLVHELGRPLGALGSAVYALGSGADQDEALRRDLLAGMDDEIHRLTRLLDDLTGLRDQVSGSFELMRQDIALGPWLPQVLAPWQQAAERAGLDWQSELQPGLPTLSVDADRLGQALGNLLSNAIKYTPSGGTITVRAGVTNAMTWIQVEDTGSGIAPEEQQRILEPFQRGQPGQRFPQGMGLGLTIARDLILAHSGRLEIDSAPGLGSRFTLWLPLPTAQA